LGHPEEAAFYYRKDLKKMESEERDGPNMVEANSNSFSFRSN
jgi:anaphase-promoting complex subunit 8